MDHVSNLTRRLRHLRELNTEEKLSLIRNSFRKRRVRNGDNFESMVESLEFAHPGKWDVDIKFQYNEANNFIYIKLESFTIHYPELLITNSKGLSHTITDFFIKLPLGESYSGTTSITEFRGRRNSASLKEVMSQYQHSHLPSRTYTSSSDAFEFRVFCTGSSEIMAIVARLRRDYDENDFKLFLFQLEFFLNWESLEGVPYTYIKNVSGRVGEDRLPLSTVKTFYTGMKNYYEANEEEMDLDFVLKKENIIIKDNHKLEKFLKYKGENSDQYRVDIVTTKDDSGNYYSLKKLPETIPESLLSSDLTMHDFMFKGVNQTFTVNREPVEEETIEVEIYLHPKIKEYVKKRMEERIQKEKSRSYILKKLNSFDNTKGNI